MIIAKACYFTGALERPPIGLKEYSILRFEVKFNTRFFYFIEEERALSVKGILEDNGLTVHHVREKDMSLVDDVTGFYHTDLSKKVRRYLAISDILKRQRWDKFYYGGVAERVAIRIKNANRQLQPSQSFTDEEFQSDWDIKVHLGVLTEAQDIRKKASDAHMDRDWKGVPAW